MELLVDRLPSTSRTLFLASGEQGAAFVVGAGLTVVVGYLLAIHVVYATLSYAVATTSADVTKGMFVATILAVPAFGLVVATLRVGAALAVGGRT